MNFCHPMIEQSILTFITVSLQVHFLQFKEHTRILKRKKEGKQKEKTK